MSKNIFANRVRVDREFLESKPRTTQKAQKGPKGKKNIKQDEEREIIRISYPVWQLPQSRAPKSIMDFEWPTFSSHKTRIKEFSRLTKGMSITEAFEAGCGHKINIDPEVEKQVNSVPREVKVGDLLDLTVESTGNNVVIDCLNLKQQLSSCVNLRKYEAFKQNHDPMSMRGRVVSANKDRVVVDPLSPMLDDWLKPILKDPNSQRVIKRPQTILVEDLKLTRGGFVGRAIVPYISGFLGENYTIEAFIPGSQIVLNIEEDFTRWEGKTVAAFVTSYIPKPGDPNQMSLICSVKEYLKFQGDLNMISLYSQWCDDGKEWEKTSRSVLTGRVTGIINSSKKCGVFVEVPSLSITGMVNVKADELVNYKPGDQVGVRLANFEENVYYDDTWKQLRHEEPYHIEDGVLTKCSLKPVLEFATGAQPE